MTRTVWPFGPLCPLALALLLATMSSADDWPQWRGPERSGAIAWAGPDTWPDALEKRWQVTLGEGHSSPAVVGDIVYQFARRGESELVRALRLGDGQTLWESSYQAPYRINPAASGHGNGPKSSPLVAGGKVYTLGIHGIVSCHDATNGQRLWQTDTNASPTYGHGMSPMLADGKLILHVGGPGRGALSALEPQSGRPIWRFEADGPGYASPILVDIDGVRQIVTQTDAHIVAVSLDTAELLWQIPFTTPYDQNIVTPILHGRTLIFSGLEARTFAISLTGDEPQELWSNRLTFYMSTPVLIGDALVGFSDKRSGHFVVLNATTGETRWTGPPRQGDNAALVVAGEWLLTLTDRAELSVLTSDNSGLDTVATYSIADSPTWAHPVPTSAGILIKDKETLTLWSTP